MFSVFLWVLGYFKILGQRGGAKIFGRVAKGGGEKF